MGQKFPIRKDILTHVHRAIEQQRKDNISKVAESSTGGGAGGGWCEIETSNWVDGGAVGFLALANLGTISEQSGGFAVVDASTLSVPAGFYEVEWAFSFSFLLQNPWSSYMAAGDFGDAWTLWRGGPAFITSSVRNATVTGEQRLDRVLFTDNGGGNGRIERIAATTQDFLVWRGLIRATAGNLNLSLGILDFHEVFAHVPDFTPGVRFTPFIQDPALGSGDHYVRIVGVG